MTTPGRRYTKAQRNADHKAACVNNGHSDRMLPRSTIAEDIENLSKVQNARPLKPPQRRSK